ncbi:hypothetical protein QBK99_23690 [Corticibacterium sp. UT-5YL-CI-8]|nr:hypothetical protein [Tianweitania sp. UT-5YL-CI-8]
MTSEQEFIAGFARAGLALPAERLDLMVKAMEGYRTLATLLHQPLDHAVEPAGLYRPEPSASDDG